MTSYIENFSRTWWNIPSLIFITSLLDQALDIYLFTIFSLMAPQVLQGIFLVVTFIASLITITGDASTISRRNRKKRKRKRNKREQRFHRSRLPYYLVRRCKNRLNQRVHCLDGSTILPSRLRKHQRWKKRQKKDHLRRWKRKLEAFIIPHANAGRFRLEQPISEENLSLFCSNTNFLAPMKLMKGFETEDDSPMAQHAVNLMNQHRAQLLLQQNAAKQIVSCSSHFKECPLVWDTGASYGLTPFRGDFIDYEECNIPVQDISKTNYVIGMGTVMWKFKATNTDTIYLPCLCYHLPTADIRLLSPQTYHQLYGGSSEIDGKAVLMSLPKQAPHHPNHQIKIPIDTFNTNIPLIHDVSCTDKERREVAPHLRSSMAKHTLNFKKSWTVAVEYMEFETTHKQKVCCPCVADESNENLSGPQRELLKWHQKLGISMFRIQEMMVEHESRDHNDDSVIMPQVIKPKFATTSSCKVPLCTVCELARAKKRNPEVIKQQVIKEKEGILAADKYEAGDFVSMDQFIVKTPGRLPTGFGREGIDNRFHGGTIFNDAATGTIFVENQVSLGAGETLMSKAIFEQWLYELAIVEVSHYRSDNGVFQAEDFKDDCADKGQKQSFSGVGAQHQNAHAERSIQTIMCMARHSLLHVSLHWTNEVVGNLSLWPFVVKHVAWLYNRMPNRVTGLTPIELLTKTKADHKDLLRSHVWGCPVFVLDPKLQNGQKIPKWNRRSRIGQFLGFSEEHSTLVGNVRHLKTGHVSPQYHCVFDDLFETVFASAPNKEVLFEAISNLLWENNRELYAEDEFDNGGNLIYTPPPLDNVWLTEPERRDRNARLKEQRIRRVKKEHELEQRMHEPAVPIVDTIPARLAIIR